MPTARTSPDLKAVYAIVGADRFLRQEALNALLAQAPPGVAGLEPSRFDGTEAELAEVLDEVRTLPLLGGRRVVIVDDADAFISAHRAAMERYCESPSPAGCLILVCDSLGRNTRLHRIITQRYQLIACEPLKGGALPGWLSERATRVYGKRLERAANALLLEQVGSAPGLLDAELAKLAVYVGARPEIVAADVEALVGQQREELVFRVVDAMTGGDVAQALRCWEQVLATDRAAEARAVGGLAYAIRRLRQAHRDRQRGASWYELGRLLFTNDEGARRMLASTSEAVLEAQLAELLEADVAVKTGLSTAASVVEKFIVRHTFGGKEAGPARRVRAR
ncbi:MAG TPA: DNA polymerase III subunit delta [Phycisphaerae bacterium]|nr:DNA polymerase III subunit delta [Phycisphaerae bacterium]HNU46626.1 DNA polymerase III subunit delta [Phycisphaerae bacterium]